jgi:hypothetical protein
MRANPPRLSFGAILIAITLLTISIIGLEKYYVYEGYQWASEQQLTDIESCQNLDRKLPSISVRIRTSSGNYADRKRVAGCMKYFTELH